MARRSDTSPADVSKARIDWLYAEMREVKGSLREAKNDGSHSAVAALHRQLQSLCGELDSEKIRQAEYASAEKDIDPADMSTEEWLEYHDEIARELPIPALERYVMAWASQHGALIEMEGGRAQLRYRQTG